MSKVSIIVPIYNAQKFLSKCIESIIMQTFVDFELILVNDGSTDESLYICKQYASKDSRIKVINKENQGSIEARKCGITQSKSNYVSFIDADDWVNRRYIEVLYRCIEESKSDISVCNFKKVLDRTGIIKRENKSWYFKKNKVYEDNEVKEYLVTAWLHGHPFPASLCAKLYKKQFLENCGKYLKKIKFLGDDLFYNMEVFLKVNRVSICNEALYYYRTGGNTSKFMPFMFDDIINAYNIQINVIEEYYQDTKEENYNGISLMLLNTFKTCLYNTFLSNFEEAKIKKYISYYVLNKQLISACKNEAVIRYFDSEFLNAINNSKIEYLYEYGKHLYRKSFIKRSIIKVFNYI